LVEFHHVVAPYRDLLVVFLPAEDLFDVKRGRHFGQGLDEPVVALIGVADPEPHH
jgi:hypothetical protein